MKPENKTDTPETLYLKEALRLSELIIEHQNKIFDAIERKAVLLTSLCLVIIGYLLSWNISDNSHWIIEISLIAIFVILAIAAFVGSLVLFPRPFALPGEDPKYLMQDKYNFNKMADGLLEDYKGRCKRNDTTLDKKRYTFKTSLWLGQCGIICAFLWIIINKSLGEIIFS